MGHPRGIRSHKLRRHDGGNALKSQDHCKELRALPLKPMECGIFSIPSNTLRPIRHGLKGCGGRESLAAWGFPWYGVDMEHTPFELTPEQKGMLASLSHETGKPIPLLLTEALEELQERERSGHAHGETNGHETEAPAPQEAYKPIWERIRETFGNLSEEDLDSLPVDGAAQVDHYAYGLPKR